MPLSLEMENKLSSISFQRVDKGEDFSKIPGLWWKSANGEIIKNKEQKRQNDLNWQIWPDRAELSLSITYAGY